MDEDNRKKLNPKLLDERDYPKKKISPEQEDDRPGAFAGTDITRQGRRTGKHTMEARLNAQDRESKALKKAEEVAEEMRKERKSIRKNS